MYTRWLQFGALSPIMRTHSQKSAGLNKEPWVFNKEYCDVLRKTIQQRYEMAPYIYTMARNQIYNFLKHQSVELNYQEKLSQENSPSYEFDMYDKLYAKELQLLIKLTLDNMPEQRRKVFSMSRQRGMSNQEIADNLQLSVRTVERHIYLALQELKKVILIAFFFCFY